MIKVTVVPVSSDVEPYPLFISPDKLIAIRPFSIESEPEVKCIIFLERESYRCSNDPERLARARARVMGHAGIIDPSYGSVHNEPKTQKE